MGSAKRRGQGFLPGPAAPQRPPGLVAPAQAAPTCRLVQLLLFRGPRGWLVVSTGVTSAHANRLWSQAQDPSPNSVRGQGPGSQEASIVRLWHRC